MDIHVIPAESRRLELNWKIYEYIGSELHKKFEITWNRNMGIPFMEIDSIKVGDIVLVHGFEYEVESLNGQNGTIKSVYGSSFAIIQFSPDSRKSWCATCFGSFPFLKFAAV